MYTLVSLSRLQPLNNIIQKIITCVKCVHAIGISLVDCDLVKDVI